jgi:hypothetical protein
MEAREKMKKINALYRKADAAGLEAMGINYESLKAKLAEAGGYWGSAPLYGILARNNKPAAIFVAVKGAIYKGSLRVGTVTSSTLAKRIVRLLNRYPANEKGV